MMKEEHWNGGRESKLRRLMQSCTKRKTNAARETEQIPDNSTGETRQRHCTFLSKWTEEFTRNLNIAIEGPPIEGFDFDSARQLFDKKCHR